MKYFITIVAIFIVGFFTLLPSTDTHAANGSDFNPGYIIDDYVFYNAGTMDAGQIQNFLNSKNPSCDYWGTQPASDWGYPNITHAQLAEYKRNGTNGFSQDSGFHAPPYRCLTMYSQSTPQMEAASGYCNAISAGDRTAAQIINDVAKACGINPQVLIILLQKEQGLVTDNWPLNRQLKHATGFACPDTAPCNPAYEGFFYQVYNAARQFKVYKAFPNSYNYRAGRTNNIYWHPDAPRCGSSSVYIQNQATAALYIYTPYRPNQAALNNLYGTGDSCSSYGNRNFWRTFSDWFGSTTIAGGYEISNKYNQMGAENSWLGRPIGSVRPAGNGGAYQQFENGKIYWRSYIGAWPVRAGDIDSLYAANRYESGYLGYPRSAEITIPGRGVYQQFEGGQVYWSTPTNANAVRHGSMFNRFAQLHYEGGYLGFPTAAEIKVKNGVYQQFEGGRLYWRTGSTVAFDIKTDLVTAHTAAGGENGYLGLPLQSMICGIKDNGCWIQMEGGKIYWSSTAGAFDVHKGDVDNKYASLKWESGALGYPTSREVSTNTTCGQHLDVKQDFQGGTIFWSACSSPSVRVELKP